ncbi:hypothetical protein V3C99_005884 [Haemonchus contortus]
MINIVLILLLLSHGKNLSNGLARVIRQTDESVPWRLDRQPRSASERFTPFSIECDNRNFDIKTSDDIKSFSIMCEKPKVLNLRKPDVLPARGMTASEFYNFVNAPMLRMCIRIEASSLINLNLTAMEELEPSCSGPALVVQQNDKLQSIKFSRKFMTHFSQVKSIRIRGNKALSQESINEIKTSLPWFVLDLQEPGECGVPSPFKTTAVLEGCKKVYGTIRVSRFIDEVKRSPTVHSLDLVGCLQIVGTRINNVDFLDDINSFSFVENTCGYEIFNNSKLCIEEPFRMKMKFPRLSIIQPDDCQTTCDGGRVDDVYLDNLYGCKNIVGNLTLHNLLRRPSRIHVLDAVTTINGTLEIVNTKSLGDFTMANLREISNPEQGPAIYITGNVGLKTLNFPKLKKIHSSDKLKVKIINNPKLGMVRAQVTTLHKLSHGRKNTRIDYMDITSFFDRLEDFKWLILAAVLLLILLLICATIMPFLIAKEVKKRQTYTRDGYPRAPYHLEKESKKILAGWVKEITTKNPLIWRCSDRPVIWSYQKGDGTHKDIDVLVANNANFLKHHMLPLAANCRIPPKDNFLLCERIKTLLSKDVAIMIGGERNPSCVLPHLPYQIKKSHTYKYLGSTYSFTLTKLKKVAPFTTAYTYEVEKAPKGKPVEKSKRTIYYFRWDYVRLPVEFDEILQLAMLYKPDKTVCISDRRKEVFSLIHMLHTFCHTLQENIGFVDALQLHTEKCNGSVLDRDELVYTMAVIMEWAYQTRSVPPELMKSFVEWCHSYAIMARFMRNNRNIKLIHPDYLTKLDPKVREAVIRDGFLSSPRFSPHRTKEEPALKRKETETTQDESDKEFWLKENEVKSAPRALPNERRDRIAV